MRTLLHARIGFFLAVRQIRRASLWTTSLIIFVMVLTFLNLVVVSGILVGLIQGSINEFRAQNTSDVLVSALIDKRYIENSPNIISLIATLPGVQAYTPRYIQGGTLEANYLTKRETEKANIASAQVVGIDPDAENAVTGISKKIKEGEFLTADDYDEVIVGSFLLKKYVPVENPDLEALADTGVGSKIRLTVNGVSREVRVKGILQSKVQEVSRRVYMLDSQFRSLIGRTDGNVAQIAIKIKPGTDPNVIRDTLIRGGVGRFARVQTFEDAQPKFLKDIVATFSILGAAFSSIGLIVASITIFIVIFINALTRRKYIGILKGIGIDGRVIEMSYIFQSIFYALIGSAVGLLIVYGFLVPLFQKYPINFPFSDGILVAPVDETLIRIALLVVSTLIAGFIPAWMIIRRNTLDSILGRN